ELFPDTSFADATIDEYNRVVGKEYDLIRDFLILHYARTDRDDTEFWRSRRTMSLPESLTHKMALFEADAHLFRDADDLFRESSWVQVMLGQGMQPRGYHRRADALSDAQLSRFMSDMQQLIAQTVDPLPSHADFVDQLTKRTKTAA
ncbi:MAG: tryptophan 7-halogenase, partial [Pseudomonadota bacterium]